MDSPLEQRKDQKGNQPERRQFGNNRQLRKVIRKLKK